jgi:hypothetical protein
MVPFEDLLRGFLKAAMQEGMEVVVWATEPNAVGVAHELVASNRTGAPERARARLLTQDGAIENVAKAIHGFRFMEAGKSAVDPTMDFCAFVACVGAVAEDAEGNRVSVGAVPWEKLPDEIKELHRTFVKVLLAALVQEPPKEEKSKLVLS